MIGEGPAARSIKLDLQPFTLVGATTRAGMLTNPLRDRFGIVARLEFYTHEELARIVHRSAQLLSVPIDEAGASEIARRARGTPRIANRLLRRVRDYAEVKAQGRITHTIADQALAMLDVDPLGFDVMDRKLLEAVVHRFDGGPVGLDNVAAAIGEERDTIEDVIEPYLIQQGYSAAHAPRPRGHAGRLSAPRRDAAEGGRRRPVLGPRPRDLARDGHCSRSASAIAEPPDHPQPGDDQHRSTQQRWRGPFVCVPQQPAHAAEHHDEQGGSQHLCASCGRRVVALHVARSETPASETARPHRPAASRVA